MTVWVVFEEWQTGCEDSAVLSSVHATEDGAQQAAASLARMYAAEPYSKTLWARDPNTGLVDADGGYGDDGWDLDVHVEAREVQS